MDIYGQPFDESKIGLVADAVAWRIVGDNKLRFAEVFFDVERWLNNGDCSDLIGEPITPELIETLAQDFLLEQEEE